MCGKFFILASKNSTGLGLCCSTTILNAIENDGNNYSKDVTKVGIYFSEMIA